MDASTPRRLPVVAFCLGHMAVDWPHGAIWILAPALAIGMDLSPGELGTLFAVTAVGSTVHAVVNRDGRPTRLPAAVREVLA